ncbi:hypothetical protein FAM6012_01739 [Lacticaseibacillus paracasei]|uniref:Uncharacterized protein n=1 Tax=Lacticaseibacillus paracasei TaxID=1597 RepID=A0A8B3GRH4_LACPA|nr:hypothetical protein FAM6012_01739 [Lacticaseibacillus paracasei]
MTSGAKSTPRAAPTGDVFGKSYEWHMYVGSIPTVLIVQFSDRTQLAMTPSDTGRASVADGRYSG